MNYFVDNSKINGLDDVLKKFGVMLEKHCAEPSSASSKKVQLEFDRLQKNLTKSYSNVLLSQTVANELFESLPIGFVVLDSEIRIVEANATARDLLLLKVSSGEELISQIFTRYIINGMSEFLERIYSSSTTPIELLLSGRNHNGIFAKVFQNYYSLNGQNFILLSIIPVQREHDLMQSLLTYKMVFEHAQEGIMVVNHQFKIQDVNPAFSKITGYRKEEVLGLNPSILSSHQQSPEFYQKMYQALDRDGYWQGVLNNRTKSGEVYPEDLQISTVYTQGTRSRKPAYYVAVFRNILGLVEKEEFLQKQADTDVLTGLLNRKGFNRIYDDMFQSAQREGEELTLIFIDLDNFKTLNDRHGHNYGDELLRNFSKRLRNGLKQRDHIARIGGDEFTIILYQEIPDSALTRIIYKLQEDLKRPYQLFDITFACSASIGIAKYPNDAVDTNSLLQAADFAMYQAKKAGKNQVQYYDHSLYSQEIEREQSIEFIRDAINKNEFENFFQPQHDMETGKLVGFEALMRWRKQADKILLPGDFLHLIADRQEIIGLSIRLIKHLVVEIGLWMAHGFRWPVSINLNAYQLAHPKIRKQLEDIAQNHSQVVPLLKIEVTETALFEKDEVIENNLHIFRELGYELQLDDFGTGYSSIYSLRKFTFQAIKIDRSFVAEIHQGQESSILLDGIIQLLQTLKLNIICEGVESEEQVNYLLERGCDVAQGFLYGQAMDKKALWSYMKKHL
ncbi:hypothetical protein THMIRHAS_00600 [Thiosulfatimonas sediminis]|uniref:GGDEF domain-containing protein n=1 Tax=Thiosulfatimonas sediminis TaxID=2675054 RepID=A0A6F8PRM7_9GAMM|nr:EAL domain-containing protein [Thiosulfatimonas sediminis]BBP44687.1 hypothetical protein THMIRHAS_00600 [Thiosulfatimonas sediminis]